MTLQHLRSSTANKRPDPTAMADGQIALNTAAASPGLFYKDSAGNLVKVGPVHVGATAPNASPASGGTAGNSVGEQWLDTTGGTYVFKVWDGSAWRSETGTFVDVNGDVMTGALGIIAGSAGSPGLYISGDTNTGIYSPGADQLALSTNGTGRLFVDASGNVKVGSTDNSNAATQYITVGSVGVTDGGLQLWARTNGQSYVQFGDTTTSADQYRGYLQYSHASDFLALGTASQERLRITSAGLVGIGNSNPQHLLDCASIGRFSGSANSAASGSGLEVGFNTGTSVGFVQSYNRSTSSWLDTAVDGANLRFNTSGTERMRLTSTGLGIGTSTPSRTLDCAGDIRSYANATEGSLILGSNNNAYIASNSAELRVWTRDTRPVVFIVNDNERARIDSSGRLLVGTSSTSATVTSLLQGNSGGTSNAGILHLAVGVTTPADGSNCGRIHFSDSNHTTAASIAAQRDGGTWTSNTSMPTRLVFSTTPDSGSSPVERLRISQNGESLFRTNANNNNATIAAYSDATSGFTGAIVDVNFAGYSPNNATAKFAQFRDTTIVRAEIRSNGGLANYQANNVNLSDRNAKKDISLAADTWNCIKEWEIVNYRYKDQPDAADLNLGVIAQQVAESCPEVITVFQEATEDESEKLGVKEQQMYWMAIKALQEAQVRIEQLEAKVAALESA